MVFSAGLTFKYIERFASISYFNKALSAQTVEDAENSIAKAIRLNPNDLYFRTATEIYAIKVNQLASKGDQLTENDKVAIQSAFSFAESSASMAIQYNNSNYLNYQTLGTTYNMAASLGVEGAYDKAVLAFIKASELNPSNPGLKLIVARTYLAMGGKIEEAKVYADQALNLKPDYIDALIVLSQIERALGNREASISYAEGALSLLPGSQELQAYVNSLRSGNVAPTPVISEEVESNPDDNQ